MAFQPRRYDRPSHYSAARSAFPVINSMLSAMYDQLGELDQATVDRVAAGIGPGGSDGSEAMEALIRAVSAAGRLHEWDELYPEVCTTLEATGLERTYAISPALLAGAFRDLLGEHGFEGIHYDAMTASWRTHVGRIHPEDESLKPGELPVFGCSPRQEPEGGYGTVEDFLRGPHT